ncbi:hypothetical protein [Nocardioides nanhaiensis]|uniref:Uncharacterized protein n=1 Tax=Nocardioides nanhaiensis TaxID=1476871 RepID=A0ABP8VR83_9ACTN
MNEHEVDLDEQRTGARLGTLLREAGPGVDEVETVALVRAGTARGRRLRRRRQGAAALAAAAVVGVVGAVGLTGALGTGAEPVQAPATQGREAAPELPPEPEEAPPARWRPVEATELAGAVESALGGQVRTVATEDVGWPIADLTWNGFAMRVYVRAAVTEGDGAARCAVEGSGPCRPVDEGAVDALTWTGPAEEGGVTGRSVTVFDDRGWDVGILVFNAADSKAGPLLADQPPLTVRELTRAILTGDGWFEAQRRG